MIVCETSTFQIGLFTVRQRPRPDNPGWAVYLVYIGERLIGKSFSIPDEGCCQWLERFNGYYATPSGSPRRLTLNAGPTSRGTVGAHNGRNGHPRS